MTERTRTFFPWASVIRFGLARLRLTPQAFWRLSLVELTALIGAVDLPEMATRQGLEALMLSFRTRKKTRSPPMVEEPNLNVSVELDLNGADRALDELRDKADAFGGALSGALKAATVDGRNLDDVLRTLGARMVGIALDTGMKPLEQLISSSISGLTGSLGRVLPFAQGGVPGRPTPFADGGVVGGPSYFPMQGGEVGLMGEAGAEAILPLSRGPDGRLGVAAGGSGQAVNVTFNVTTPDAQSFSKSEAQITAMLARAVGRGRRGL